MGEGVERRQQAALAMLEAASTQGDAYAMVMLAWVYRRGEGVARDEAKAEALNAAAAALRHPEALVRAAMFQLKGTPAPADKRKAEIYFREAAATGDPKAMLAFGMQLYAGTTFERDPAKAFALLRHASEKGEVLARLWLAQCYVHGFGVDANAEKAEAIFKDAQKSASVSVLNNFSWSLAVSREAALRDGDRAVSIMSAALADPANRSPGNLDTLAAAYAEAGRFDEAIEAQAAAIEAARKGPSRRPELEKELTGRLTLYRARKPYRE